jgi:hypothetical protein
MYQVLREMRFELLTTPGTVTYSRQEDPNPGVAGEYQSTLDLTFVSSELRPLAGDSWDKFWTDHRPIELSLAIEPTRENPERYLYHLTDKVKLRGFIASHLGKLDKPDLCSKEAIEDYVEKFLQIFRAALSKEQGIVPQASPRPYSKVNSAMTPAVKEALAQQKSMCRLWARTRRDKYYEAMKKAKRQKDHLIRIEGQKGWRTFIGKTTNARDVFRIARIGAHLGKPVRLRHMPPLVESAEVTHHEQPAKADCMRYTILQGTNDAPIEPSSFPDLDPSRTQYECSQEISDEDIIGIIKESNNKKAQWWGKVSNELFKMTIGIVEPYIAHMFRACLLLSFTPETFKRADTIMIPKEGKENYGHPKSWRPVALLSHLGKMLEKLVA